MKHSFILCCLLVVLSNCSKADKFLKEGDYYFLKNDEAVMPVWVRGNVASGIFIITLHGGPGSSGHEFVLSKGFEALEKKYAVVYWDQRFAGMSQGNPSPGTLNIPQFIEDTHQCIQLIRGLYQPKSIFLMGHSWGGGLGTAYLGRDNHQSGINGWIDIDGSKNDTLETQAVKSWVTNKANEYIAAGKDPDLWNYALEWYEKHPEPVYSDFEPYVFVSAASGDIYDRKRFEEINKIPYVQLITSSPFSVAFFIDKTDISFVDGINFTSELNAITIPSLVLWGEDDGLVPLPAGNWTYQELGTPAQDKYLRTFKECAHSPHFEHPELFFAHVTTFIEHYKTP